MAQSLQLSEVADALGVGSHELISLVGGGGKSTLLFAIGRALRGEVVLTTTTRMGGRQTNGMTPLVAPTDDELRAALHHDHRVLVRDRTEPGTPKKPGKAIGPPPTTVDRWFDIADHVVVEADGAKHRPFKAPAEHEPRVPLRTTLLVAVIGADAIGRCIGDQCFRPMRVAAIAGCGPYDRLTPERAARVLTSDRGSRKNLPSQARFAVAITKVEPDNCHLVDETVAALRSEGVICVQVAEAR